MRGLATKKKEKVIVKIIVVVKRDRTTWTTIEKERIGFASLVNKMNMNNNWKKGGKHE